MSEIMRALGMRKMVPHSHNVATSLELKKGQIVHGKIKEIHPNQLATIKIGQHELTAKVEVPVEKGQTFLFEVQTNETIPKLKIVQEQKQALDQQVESLLKTLSIQPSKENKQFVRQLLLENVPFKPEVLKEGLKLMNQDPTAESKDMLLYLMKNQIPVSKPVLDAFMHQPIDSQNAEIKALIEVLIQGEQTPEKLALLSKLNESQGLNFDKFQGETMALLNQKYSQQFPGVTFSEHLEVFLTTGQQEQMNNGNLSVFFQLSEALSGTQEALSPFNQSIKSDLSQLEELVNVVATKTDQQITTLDQLSSRINELFNRQLGMEDKTIHLGNRLMNELGEAISKNMISDTDVMKLTRFIKQDPSLINRLTTQLSPNDLTELNQFLSMPSKESLESIISFLKPLLNQQLTTQEQREMVNTIKNFGIDQVLDTKHHFLLDMKYQIHHSGLEYESSIARNEQDATLPLKQLLMSFLNQNTQSTQAEELLQTITKQQVNMLQQDQHFMHLSLTVPTNLTKSGEVYIDIKGQKNKADQLDPDYCRVAFYLDLDHLGETVIDMTIQNRNIQLTIINDDDLKLLMDTFKGPLKEGLKKIDYHLSSVSYRPYQTYSEINESKNRHPVQEKGWDFRA